MSGRDAGRPTAETVGRDLSDVGDRPSGPVRASIPAGTDNENDSQSKPRPQPQVDGHPQPQVEVLALLDAASAADLAGKITAQLGRVNHETGRLVDQTVTRDLSTVTNVTVDEVLGLDGKTRPASRPSPAEKIAEKVAEIADQARVIAALTEAAGVSPNGDTIVVTEGAARHLKPHLEVVKERVAEAADWLNRMNTLMQETVGSADRLAGLADGEVMS